MTIDADLNVSEDGLTKLADDMDSMQRYLDRQVRRMDAVVDRIEAGWRGETGSAYRALHRAAAEDTVRIREILVVLEQAVRMSRNGFTQQELDTLQSFRGVHSSVDVAREVDRLSEGPASPGPRSSLLDI
ncbi:MULTISPECIES: WXG100 family type VII secretion target [Streptomyces]|uniref:WXG100 family type VII secretion target n=1 Tax=Streptomyces TaxID=1883 RepID=UPI0009C32686|nr:WXG100 family type VII secretion target [Streptomyces sp. Sge12]ARE74551.1 WXG100 family type VII secretion target [Streptomyces sp. Sge12]